MKDRIESLIACLGVTLAQSDLREIARAIRLSPSTMGNIRENLFFASIYNVLGVPIAATTRATVCVIRLKTQSGPVFPELAL